MTRKDIANKIVQHLIQDGVKISKAYISIYGKKYKIDKVESEHILNSNFSEIECVRDLLSDIRKLPYTDSEKINRDIVTCLIEWKTRTSQQFNIQFESDLQKASYENLRIFVNYHTGSDFLWNTKENIISEMHCDAFRKLLGKQIFEMFLSEKPRDVALLTFDPYRGLTNKWEGVKDSIPVTYLNTYRPPAWYTQELTHHNLSMKKEKYPAIFNKFLEHLFPVKEHRDRVLDWLCLAMFSRPISYLSLRGTRGNGKTVFKHMIYHLVGNSLETSEDILGDFNVDLRDKRIIGIDDNKKIGTRDGNAIRKKILNPTMHMNEKRVQTYKSEETHFSMVICSNTNDMFYVEHDERRIVSPKLCDLKMEDTFPEGKTEYLLLTGFAQDDLPLIQQRILKEIGYSLFARYKQKYPPKTLILKAGTFWSDVLHSLSGLKKHALDMILKDSKCTKIDFEELKDSYKFEESYAKVSHWSTFLGWLKSGFEYRDKKLIIDPERDIDKKKKCFYPNPDLVGLHEKK